ncbi:MAG: hypothetical protein IPM54_25495 [Polyangiaceae bacterium]|nr:hypothetical protein [Polyangiaceae bacterium]
MPAHSAAEPFGCAAFEPDPAPCPVPVSLEERPSDARLLFGQASNPPIRSPFFCDQQPRGVHGGRIDVVAGSHLAYQSAYDQAYKTGKALALAEAEMQAVINKSDSWLKRALTSDPGTIEQIQQRVTDALNSIEPLPEYDDPTLESLAWAGYQAGFENGKFEVEAKLFAIDAGVMLIEFALLEVAMGPLGGATSGVGGQQRDEGADGGREATGKHSHFHSGRGGWTRGNRSDWQNHQLRFGEGASGPFEEGAGKFSIQIQKKGW